MAEQPDQNQQIVIKKVKKGHGGHHGGAWKIAYADFVTAMMAFFLLMWLLGSMGEEDLKGISEYFSNPTKVTLEGGNSAGMSESLIDGGGDDLTRQEGQVNAGEKPTPEKRDTQSEEKTADPADMTEEQIQERIEALEREQIEELKERLESLIEVDPALKAYKDQIKLDITRDGLRIQIIDKETGPCSSWGRTTCRGMPTRSCIRSRPFSTRCPTGCPSRDTPTHGRSVARGAATGNCRPTGRTRHGAHWPNTATRRTSSSRSSAWPLPCLSSTTIHSTRRTAAYR